MRLPYNGLFGYQTHLESRGRCCFCQLLKKTAPLVSLAPSFDPCWFFAFDLMQFENKSLSKVETKLFAKTSQKSPELRVACDSKQSFSTGAAPKSFQFLVTKLNLVSLMDQSFPFRIQTC